MAKKKKKLTISEFKVWIEGIGEVQPDGWTPSQDQWQMILDRITNIIEPKIIKPQQVVAPMNVPITGSAIVPQTQNPPQSTSTRTEMGGPPISSPAPQPSDNGKYESSFT